MRVLLRINGWEKIEEIEDYVAQSGSVQLNFRPCFPIEPYNPNKLPISPKSDDYGHTYLLTYYPNCERKFGLPVFEYKEK